MERSPLPDVGGGSSQKELVRARIDAATKERAAAALEAMGLSVSDAIRLLMLRIADEQRLPFEVKVPNATTRRAMAELERITGQRLSPGLADPVARLNQALEAAGRFLDYSRRRSRQMVERTMSLLEQRREDRALLVVGGFHSRAVTRALDDYPDVSWAVVMPAVDVKAAWQQHQERF